MPGSDKYNYENLNEVTLDNHQFVIMEANLTFASYKKLHMNAFTAKYIFFPFTNIDLF